ncbi:MAG: hypothetical protein AAFU03_18970, partial [Bacteroidota bacterium]
MPGDRLENFINQQRKDFDQEAPRGMWERIEAGLTEQKDRKADDLFAFVRDNRAAFDADEPPAALWVRILAAIPSLEETQIVKMRSAAKRKTFFRMAAAVALILLASTLYLGRQLGYQAAQQEELAVIQSVAPDFLEMEDYYQQQIDQAYQQVSLANDDPTLRADLASIDEAMEELRQELVDVPLEERAFVIAQLIESYQIKLRILERVLKYLPKKTD